jgi:hypothetical protein
VKDYHWPPLQQRRQSTIYEMVSERLSFYDAYASAADMPDLSPVATWRGYCTPTAPLPGHAWAENEDLQVFVCLCCRKMFTREELEEAGVAPP